MDVFVLLSLVCYNFTNKANSHTPKVEIHITQKLCHFGRYVAKSEAILPKKLIHAPKKYI